jgi:hypothetical protein
MVPGLGVTVTLEFCDAPAGKAVQCPGEGVAVLNHYV